jgi:hypothetical protein
LAFSYIDIPTIKNYYAEYIPKYYFLFRRMCMMSVMTELTVIMAIEWSMVAVLYASREKSVRIWRTTFISYKIGVSVRGCTQVFRMVGIKAMRSMVTTIMTETVGSWVSIHGMSPRRAIMRK